MLTFEDFFLKKRIDLLKLQAAQPALFAEFGKHYPLMGEKSFDHAKKYWFNQLRRAYPLNTEVKPHAVKAESVSAMAIQGVAAAAAQNLNTLVEKPKFSEDHLAELVEENVSVKEVSLAEEQKIITKNEIINPVAKPAFKPRFNAGSVKKTESPVSQNAAEDEVKLHQTAANENEPVKPGFKPRFNTQNLKNEAVKEVPAENTIIESKNADVANEKIENQDVKPVYKPRFQMKHMPKPPAP